jgi:predicted dehydrogenase
MSKSSSTRREFLQMSGQLAAASAVAGLVVPRVHAAGSDTIRLALIGCGPRGSGAVGDAMASTGGQVKLYAMADIFDDKLQGSLGRLKRQFGDKVDVSPDRCFVGFDAYRKAIDCLGPGDVAMLTTRAAFRPQHFEYAVEKGVNVFMEKSFAVDSPGTRRMMKSAELADKKNLKVAVGFMWRHSKARQEVIRRIQDGAIGDLHTLRIYRVHGPSHCPAKPKQMSDLMFQLKLGALFNWVGAGFLIDWHCHNIDVACWTKGSWPVAAQGMGGRCYPQAGNLFDHYAVEYTFADGAKLFAFSRHMNGCWNEYADYAQGTKGSAVIMTNLATPKPRIYKGQNMADANLLWRYAPDDVNPYHAEWQDLLDAIRHDKPYNEARRGAEANFAALMGRMAAHTGKYVTWDEAVNSNFSYVKDLDHLTFDSPAPLTADANGFYAAPQPGQCQEI